MFFDVLARVDKYFFIIERSPIQEDYIEVCKSTVRKLFEQSLHASDDAKLYCIFICREL